jgi:hypothetical protein
MKICFISCARLAGSSIAENSAAENGLRGFQDRVEPGVQKLLPRNEYQIVSQIMSRERLHDAAADLPLDTIPENGIRDFLADRYSDPEAANVVLGIKKRKTVKRQSFSLHGLCELPVAAQPFVLAICVRHAPVRSDREALPALGSATIENFTPGRRAHPLAEALRPLLFEIAFLCCCFRHRSCSFMDILKQGGIISEKVRMSSKNRVTSFSVFGSMLRDAQGT